MVRFSVIIVSYESADWLPQCLNGLATQTEQNFEVILVDNASQDGSAKTARDCNLERVRVIENKTNLGFAAACNQGAQQAEGEWLVFLNPDTVPRPDWLSQVRLGQTRYPDVSVFSCAQYNLDDRSILDGVGDAYFGFGIPWRGGFGHPASALPDEGECFSPCGAAAVIRRDLFIRADGFDEQFFCYCEDVDLGFRLRLMGENCIFLNKAAVDHKGSGVTGRYSEFTVYHGTRNRLWTYFKNMPLGLLILTLPGHILISVYLILKSMTNGRLGPTWRGLRDGIIGLPKIISCRKSYTRPENAVPIRKAMTWNIISLHKRRPSVRSISVG